MILALESTLMTGGSITVDDQITWVNEMNATREIGSHSQVTEFNVHTTKYYTHVHTL